MGWEYWIGVPATKKKVSRIRSQWSKRSGFRIRITDLNSELQVVPNF
jgi:hypothetical protein